MLHFIFLEGFPIYYLQIFCGSGSSCLSQEETSSELATALGHITVVSKGPRDVITNGRVSLACLTPGSPKYEGQFLENSGVMVIIEILSNHYSGVKYFVILQYLQYVFNQGVVVHILESRESLSLNPLSLNQTTGQTWNNAI